MSISDINTEKVEEATRFLNLLYGEDSLGHLVVWTTPGMRSTWVAINELSDAALFAIHESQSKNVYFGVAPQDKEKALQKAGKSEEYVRGYSSTAVALPGVWLDIDIKGDAHKAENLPPTLSDAITLLDEFPLPPTIKVHSGHGLQVFYLFKEPWILENEDERNEAQELSNRFLKTMQQVAQQYGWKIDAVSDLARVLRVPGTWNRKPNLDPVEVKILEINEDARYNIDDIEQYLLDDEQIDKLTQSTPQSNLSPKVDSNNSVNTYIQLDDVTSGCAWLRHCKEDAESLPEPEWYAMLTVVGRCINGDEMAHEWSSPYSRYSSKETEYKLKRALNGISGPFTCKKISEISGGSWCLNCPFNGRITSPINIGLNKTKYLEDVTMRHQHSSEQIKPQKFQKPYLHLVTTDEEITLRKVKDMLDDSPTPHLNVPDSYFLNDAKTIQIITKNKGKSNEFEIIEEVALAPVLITGLLRDITTNQEFLKVSWKRGNKWLKEIVDRETIANARKIVELAGRGFPVYSGSAGALSEYLSKFEAANFDLLSKTKISSQLGWQGKEGEDGFLWGSKLIRSNDFVDTSMGKEDHRNNESVIFKGQDFGDEQIAKGYTSAGTLKDWIEVISKISSYPKVLFGFYTAFVPPLLKILNIPNFIVDFSNRTSTGKTTVQRIAASVVGNPDETAPESALGTWDATNVWLERASGVVTGLPLILDDTKRVRNKKTAANMLYALANGRGRSRGNKNSLSQTTTWNTVLISSGEVPVTSFTTDGGTRGRVLEVRGMPFGSDGQETRKLVQEINRKVIQNYGHGLPLFVQYILKNKSNWKMWQTQYHALVEEYAQRVDGNVAGRLANYMAGIDLAAQLVHKAFEEAGFPLSWSLDYQLKNLWQVIARESDDATGEEAALREISSWATSNETFFYGRHQLNSNGDPLVPTKGWMGRWDKNDNWKFIAFYPDQLKHQLSQLGYEPDEILSHWKERGWLDVSTNQPGVMKKVRINGNASWLITLKREAIDEIE